MYLERATCTAPFLLPLSTFAGGAHSCPGHSWLAWRQGLGLSPAELTALNLDKSALLEQVMGSQYGDDPFGIVGELQVGFVA